MSNDLVLFSGVGPLIDLWWLRLSFDIMVLVPLVAVICFIDVGVKLKTVLSLVYLGMWGLTWLTSWAYYGLLLYGAFVYFMYFGPGPGRPKR